MSNSVKGQAIADPGRPTEPDHREVFRIEVDVLATARQIEALYEVIGDALCQGPGDHPGPCRIAWSMHAVGGASIGEKGGGLSRKDAAWIRADLEPVDVWPPSTVDESLGITDPLRLHGRPDCG